MGQSYFIWKNKDCRSMGVKLSGPAAIIRPEERVNHIEIPGRSGDLTQLQGENIYNSYIQTVTILVKGGYRTRELFDWLRGSGYVTFSGEPEKRQAARIIGAVTLNRHSFNLDWWEGEVQFYCQPLKQKSADNTVTITSSGSTVLNAGDVDALPLMAVTANATSLSVTAGGKTLSLGSTVSGTTYLIDSEVQEVLSADRSTVLTANSSGEFPVLKPGSNSVTGSGWSSITIDRRERFL